jgi:DNA-binding NarL/FixJ family response regulator
MDRPRPLVATGDRQLKRQINLAMETAPDHAVAESSRPLRGKRARRRLVILSSQELTRYKAKNPTRLRVIKQQACLVIVVQHQETRKILDAIQVADGLVFREVNLQHLQLIAELAESGYVAIPSLLASQLVNKGLRRELLQSLSSLEHRVLTMLGRGSSNRIIGAALNIDEGRTKYLIRSVFKKLHLQNRTQAAVFARDVLSGAMEHGLTMKGGEPSREPGSSNSFGQHLATLFS